MKKHKNKTHHRHNNLILPSSLQHPPHLFNCNTNHTQPLHLTFKTSNHSYSNKITIQIFNNMMIRYACTNEKYLIPISIIPHTTILHSTKHPCCTIYKQHSTSFSPRTTYSPSLSTSPQMSPSITLQLYSSSYLYPSNQTPTQTHITSTSTHATHHSFHLSNCYSL